jgi:acylphosphatase
MKEAYKIRVSGRVQGVGFRNAATREARHLGLKGWVRNESDGSVRMQIQGSQAACNGFIAWCHRGPGYAWVEKVDVQPVELSGLEAFRVIC